MRSRDGRVPDGVAVERALSEGVCGLGGVLADAPISLDEALERAHTQYDDRVARRLRRFADVPTGAYVWTRDVEGLFWLGRLGGEWRYDASEGATNADLVHVRPCTWLQAPIAESQVPSAVLATFARGGKNWQQTHSEAAEEASAGLWQRARQSHLRPQSP
ncbi:GAF domain-containing protein [Demequina sp. SO4-13]|uniref:GAF domain-containing protein n=1 Tax=Demequina sp. SO4-13 TaxID=3401027 RepID=UPI003AF797AD